MNWERWIGARFFYRAGRTGSTAGGDARHCPHRGKIRAVRYMQTGCLSALIGVVLLVVGAPEVTKDCPVTGMAKSSFF